MNAQPLNVKSLALVFVIYVVSTVFLAVILSIAWQAGIDTTGYTPQQLVQMADNSSLLTVGATIIGSTMSVICAYMITRRTGDNGYKHAVCFAACLILYGVISIVLHPEHHIIQQVAKLLAPVPLCSLGAWLAIQQENKKESNAQHQAC